MSDPASPPLADLTDNPMSNIEQPSTEAASPLTSATPIFPLSDSALSAVELLQVWGVWPDQKRGRHGCRPREPHFPSFISQQLGDSSLSNEASYIARASAAVISELWADARRADTRLRHSNPWVPATVSSPLVHPAVDRIDSADDGPRHRILYLTIPNNKLRSFQNISVVCVRDPRAKSMRLLEVKKLKRCTNQILVLLAHVGADALLSQEIPTGTTFEIAPYCGIRTRSSELSAIRALAKKDSNLLQMLLQPQLPIARVEDDDDLIPTSRSDPREPLRTVPDRFNKRASSSAWSWLDQDPYAPQSLPTSAIFSRDRRLFSLPDPDDSVVEAVEQLEEGIVMVHAYVRHSLSVFVADV